jgi:predicted RNase H-like HicB family nuclease
VVGPFRQLSSTLGFFKFQKLYIGNKCGILFINEEEIYMKFTAVFQKFPEGYAAFIEELPGANTQGRTLEEARNNLSEAVELVLETNRQLAEETMKGQDVIRESFLIPA